MSRRPIISGNWKMHHNHFEAIQFVQKLSYLLGKEDYAVVDVTIHPPFTDIRSVQTLLEADDIPMALGAQHCHWDEKGAFTGEVSPVFLAKLAVQYVITGHSERRELFGETDEMVARKTAAIQQHGMTPIVCVGETLDEREAEKTLEVLDRQLRHGLEGISPASIGALAIAYEPVWAIGTGKVASTAQAQEAHAHIRNRLRGWFGAEAAAACRVLYGGSVKPANARELLSQPDVDGALVGGASLEVRGFVEIVAASRPGRV
jgi:triosephosphate isomerase